MSGRVEICHVAVDTTVLTLHAHREDAVYISPHTVVDRRQLPALNQLATRSGVSGFTVRWRRRSLRGFNMLTDMILEEEFEKNEESWYDPRDLEHGKSCSVAPQTVSEGRGADVLLVHTNNRGVASSTRWS